MDFMRAIFRLIIFIPVTLFFYSLIMVSLALSIVGFNYQKTRGYLLRTWGKTCCFILGIHLEVENTPPEPPFLLVSNHLSYLDVFVLFSQLRCLFVAKSDVKTWPLAGFIIKTCGILFIDRSRKRDVKRVNALISENITDDQGIILFPEGTTSPGLEVLPFKTSLLQYSATEHFPISHVSISYKTDDEQKPAYNNVCWWGDVSFMTHFWNLLHINKIKAKMVFGKEKILSDDRKELALKLHKCMADNFEPVVSDKKFYELHDDYKSQLPV